MVALLTVPAGRASTPTVVIDACVWISWFVPHDSNYAKAQKWLNAHAAGGGQMIAPAFLLLEVAAGTARAINNTQSAQQLANYLASLPSLLLLDMDQSLVADAINLSTQYRLKAGDALYVVVSQRLGIPLLTFNQETIQRTVTIITTIAPP